MIRRFLRRFYICSLLIAAACKSSFDFIIRYWTWAAFSLPQILANLCKSFKTAIFRLYFHHSGASMHSEGYVSRSNTAQAIILVLNMSLVTHPCTAMVETQPYYPDENYLKVIHFIYRNSSSSKIEEFQHLFSQCYAQIRTRNCTDSRSQKMVIRSLFTICRIKWETSLLINNSMFKTYGPTTVPKYDVFSG